MLYSELPWKNPMVELIYWVTTLVYIVAMQMTWSWLLAIPGCLAFQYECLLKQLTVNLKSHQNFQIGRTGVFEYYSHLEYSTRLLFENGFSKAVFALYFLLGLQQTLTSFFIFDVLRNGGSWDEVKIFLIDMLVRL